MYIGSEAQELPKFCDECGVAHPWASREERIFELENILDEEEIDDADRVVIERHLRELRETDLIEEKREKQLWGDISKRAGGALRGPAIRVVEGLVSAKIRADLGI
jgi:hypothetical protein